MRLVIDTEFNGFGGQLISMALVAEDGQELYEVLPLPDVVDPWVAKHVVPILNKGYVSQKQFTAKLHSFLSNFVTIELIADWPEDIKHFCDALVCGPGQRIGLNDQRPKFVLDFGLPSTHDMSKIPHNALEDARALARAVFKDGV